MSRGSGWRWAFVPRWLIDSEAFLCLDHRVADLLFRLYLTCDAHGRFQAGAHSLRRLTGIFDENLFDDLLTLSPAFVTLYDVDGVTYGQISEYDDDAPRDLTRKRGRSVMPGADEGQTKGIRRPDEGHTPSAQIDKRERLDKIRDETDQARTTRAGAYIDGGVA